MKKTWSINTPEKLKRMLWETKINVTESGCWEWTGSRYSTNYGEVWQGGKRRLAHRVSYELAKGPLAKGEVVMHVCDNPPCVNPDHLVKGTQFQNVLDMQAKGRMYTGAAPGEANGNAKLTWAKVREIRRLYATRQYTMIHLGKIYEVDYTTISMVVRHKVWKE